MTIDEELQKISEIEERNTETFNRLFDLNKRQGVLRKEIRTLEETSSVDIEVLVYYPLYDMIWIVLVCFSLSPLSDCF